jgi:hypothetical protein
MTKARQLADLGNAYDDGALSNRNLIINGAMQVAQRGTSFSHNGVVGQFPVDRMNVAIYTSGWSSATGGTSSQVSITDTFNETVNFTKAVRLTPSSDWGRAHWFYKIEGVEFLSAKTVTLSFWARVNTGTLTLSNSNGTGDTRFDQQFGSGGSSIVIQEVNPNITISTSWQKFTITHTFASTNGKTIGTSPYINATILNDVDLSSVGWLEMTGIQLEVGDTATPFEHRSYGDELAKCQRYTFVVKGDDNDATGFVGYSETTSAVRFGVRYPVTMRASPSFTLSGTCRAQGGTNDTANFSSGLALVHPNNSHDGSCIRVTGTSGAGAADRGFNLQFKSNGASLTFDAEL